MSRPAQKQRLAAFAQEAFGVLPEYLWADSPGCFVLRHPITKKWFAVFMDVSGRRLGLESGEMVSIVNVKCDPLLIGSLLMEEGFFPAYHMNKSLWISILLDEKTGDKHIASLLEMSYEAVSLKRKKRRGAQEKSGELNP